MKFGIPTLIGPCQARPCALPSPMSFYSPHTLTRSISDPLHTPPQPGRLLQAWPGGALAPGPAKAPVLLPPSPDQCGARSPFCDHVCKPPAQSHTHKEKGGSALCTPVAPKTTRASSSRVSPVGKPGPLGPQVGPGWDIRPVPLPLLGLGIRAAALNQPWRQRTALGRPHGSPTPSVFSSRLMFLLPECLEIMWDFLVFFGKEGSKMRVGVGTVPFQLCQVRGGRDGGGGAGERRR